MSDQDAFEEQEERVRAVEAQKRAAEINALYEERMFVEVLGNEYGRAFIHWLLDGVNMYETTFHPDHAMSSAMEGKRQVGLAVRARVMECHPAMYDKIFEEARERQAMFIEQANP